MNDHNNGNSDDDNNGTTYGTVTVTTAPLRRRARRDRARNRYFCASCCCCLFLLILIVLFILLGPMFIMANASCPFQNPLCWPWQSASGWSYPGLDLKQEKFAVGFDLSTGYGTVAIGWMNGTSEGVGKYRGGEEYVKVMEWANDQENIHSSPPYYGGAASDSWRQWGRWWRKKRGLPASDDVAALVAVLAPLKTLVDEALGKHGPCKYGMITVPQVPALYNEDLVDAADFVGFQLVIPYFPVGDSAQETIPEIGPVFTGMTLNQPNDRDCKADTLVVSLTQSALTSHPVRLACPYNVHGYVPPGFNDFSLGRAAAGEGESEVKYWELVRAAIDKSLKSHTNSFDFKQVVLHGEYAEDENLQRVLRQSLSAHQKGDDAMPRFFVNEPLYAGAKGAAELAKRCFLGKRSEWCIPDLHPRMQGW